MSLFRSEYNWDEVTNPITDEEVKIWVDALRSGDYPQTQRCLKDAYGFCCLGVLNEVVDDALPDPEGSVLYFDEIVDGVETTRVSKLPIGLQDELAGHNDGDMWERRDPLNFNQIADIIEEGFKS